MKELKITLPEKVSYIIKTLTDAGYEAYAVGGCVRDTILGRNPDDWDITTSAMPLETKALFGRTIDTGIKHGTVTVMLGKDGFEVTTYRVDGAYTDSRHPDSVSFTRSLEEDLKRRDFTINAMAYNQTDGLQDLFGGSDDLVSKVIRCVGLPSERFSEDALRILRAVRFSAQLGFAIDKDTAIAAAKTAPTLVNISAERIHAELDKLLKSNHPDRLFTLHELGIDTYIYPELKVIFDSSAERIKELVRSLEAAPKDLRIRWALLGLCTGNYLEVMHRLKFDNATIDAAKMLINNYQLPYDGMTDIDMRRLMNKIGAANIPLLLDFRAAFDSLFSSAPFTEQYERILAAKDATSIKELAINGVDLINLGLPRGSEIGRVLDQLMEEVLVNPQLNTRDILIQRAEEIIHP